MVVFNKQRSLLKIFELSIFKLYTNWLRGQRGTACLRPGLFEIIRVGDTLPQTETYRLSPALHFLF